MRQLVISTSLAEASKSRILARAAAAALREQGDEVLLFDLAEHTPPLAGAGSSWQHPAALALQRAIREADGLVLALGIYNYGPSAAAKTVLELGGAELAEMPVSLLCAAGGQASYMAVMPLITALMLDFRCLINPRFVYATSHAFAADRITAPEVGERTAQLVASHRRLTGALASRAG